MTKYCFVFSLLLCFSCNRADKTAENTSTHYTTKSYVDVGKLMDSVKAPYIIDVGYGHKRIVLIGCMHDMDSSHPQFAAIEKYFSELKPQLVFNEGGQVPDSIHYTGINDAIKENGETGALKFYADKAHINMLNGDLDARTEFALTLKKQSKDNLFLYYVVERIAIPYHYGAYKNEAFEAVFNRLVAQHFVKNGFPLSAEEQTIEHFKALYSKNFGKNFDVRDFDLEAFDYINDDCKFCAVGRLSKTTRDSILLSKIDDALNQYDRVMITFGHGHALAIEPALKEIVIKKRATLK